MINTTDRLIVLTNGEALHSAVQNAIAFAIEMIERQLNRRSTFDVKHFAFYKQFGTHNQLSGVRFDENFLSACFEANLGDARNSETKDARKKLSAYFLDAGIPATGLSSLRRGIKLMLVELWRAGSLLLPTTFTVGAHFPIEFFDHQLLVWLKSYDPAVTPEGSGTADARRLFFYGPRLLWATDWRGPQDISLSDLAALQRALILYKADQSTTVIAGGHQLPITIVAAEGLRAFPGAVQYTSEDVSKFSRWSMSGAGLAMAFEDFKEGLKPAKKRPTARKRSLGCCRFRGHQPKLLELFRTVSD